MTHVVRVIGILGVALLVNTVRGQGTSQPVAGPVTTTTSSSDKSSGKASDKSLKDQIRNQMRDKHVEFLQKQKDLLEEPAKRSKELEAKLPNHGELINAAKEAAKGHKRKDD